MLLPLLRCGHRLLSLRPPTSIAALRSYSLPAPNPDPAAAAAAGEPEMIDPRKLPSDYEPSTFDPASHRPPPTDRVWRLVDEVCNLTLAEVAELSSLINPNPDPPVIGILGTGGGGGAGFGVAAGKGGEEGAAKGEKKVEKTVFELRLESFETANKLKVIKEVRAYSELGLKEAKELVEKAPAVFKAGVSKEEAEKIIEKMKEVGAKVVME